MKSLGVFATVLAISMVQGNFLGYLKELETHSEYQNLSTDQQLLFAELVMATETNTLKEFIDRVGYLAVVQLLDDMSYADAHKFMAYLSEHLGYHNHAPGSNSILHKRDHDSHDDDDRERKNNEHHDNGNHNGNLANHLNNHNEHYSNHLTNADKQIWDGLLEAAKTNTVTQYIDSVGMGAILGLMEKMDPAHAQELFALIEAQLHLEDITSTTVVKRDSGSDEDDSDDSDSDDNDDGNSGRTSKTGGRSRGNNDDTYQTTLTSGDARILKGLRGAAKTNSLTSYIDQVGFGQVLGLMEQFGEAGAQNLFDFLEAQLQKEAVVKRDDDDDDSDDSDDSDDDDDDSKGRLAKDDARILKGLRGAAKTNSLTSYIDQVGFGQVLGLMEQFGEAGAQDLFAFLEAQLQKEAVVKRDDDDDDSDSDDSDDDDDDSNGRLAKDDDRILKGLRGASKTNSLTSYIDQVGFGQVLGLMEQFGEAGAQDLFALLEAQLQKEAVVKRDDDDDSDSDDSDDDDDDDDNNGRLASGDARILKGLRGAAKANSLTPYIDQVGFGQVLGVMEQFGEAGAQDLFDFLEAQLQKEAQA